MHSLSFFVGVYCVGLATVCVCVYVCVCVFKRSTAAALSLLLHNLGHGLDSPKYQFRYSHVLSAPPSPKKIFQTDLMGFCSFLSSSFSKQYLKIHNRYGT